MHIFISVLNSVLPWIEGIKKTQLKRMKRAIPPLTTVLTPSKQISDFLGLQPIIFNLL